MAYFAKIGLNGRVITVVSVNNEVLKDSNGVEREELGVEFLNKFYGWPIWKQTSYNTHEGVHKNNGIPFRKNYAGIGYTYNADIDAFVPPKPFASWTLNNETAHWEAPVAMPIDDKMYTWDEATTSWKIVDTPI